MDNQQRRVALATARRKCLEYAELAEKPDFDGNINRQSMIERANMWANIANAMKVGQSLEADGVIDPHAHMIER